LKRRERRSTKPTKGRGEKKEMGGELNKERKQGQRKGPGKAGGGSREEREVPNVRLGKRGRKKKEIEGESGRGPASRQEP